MPIPHPRQTLEFSILTFPTAPTNPHQALPVKFTLWPILWPSRLQSSISAQTGTLVLVSSTGCPFYTLYPARANPHSAQRTNIARDVQPQLNH